MIEHELNLTQVDKVGFNRKYYGVDLHTWSLTKEQAHWIYQRVSGLIEEAERKKPEEF